MTIVTAEETQAFDIPKDPLLLARIRTDLNKVEESKVRAAAERDLQTAIFKELAEATKLPNNTLRKLANVINEGGVQKLTDEVENLEALYVAINNPNVNKAVALGGATVVLDAPEDVIQAAINEATGQA
jgi:hypothetical protein